MMPARAMLAAVGVVATVAFIGCAGDDGAAPFNDSITESGLSADLHILSHDSMGGRLVGSAELDRASNWIRDRFAGANTFKTASPPGVRCALTSSKNSAVAK